MLPGHLGKGLSQQRKWIITAFILNKDKNKMRYHFEHGRRDRRKLYLRFTFLPPPSFGFFKIGMLQKSASLKREKLPFLEFALKYLKTEYIKNIPNQRTGNTASLDWLNACSWAIFPLHICHYLLHLTSGNSHHLQQA